ncbi:hypothetical protein RFI_20596 [Reticulomyxa filosa]|uniref:Uncharacterized protein n=1 Tax=Reticulomyxa filosa TaxID=46433 RepID=X6MRV9_RETFI|nr:hypothetical protein RFI_20596 [Reticulomyxa filosa]|eukprot:ETO16743.1 hypothetical protein RFI_20596 [Reticulomyxa filosa]
MDINYLQSQRKTKKHKDNILKSSSQSSLSSSTSLPLRYCMVPDSSSCDETSMKPDSDTSTTSVEEEHKTSSSDNDRPHKTSFYGFDLSDKLLPWSQRALTVIGSPTSKCRDMYRMILKLQKKLEENLSRSDIQPYLDESREVMKQRWDKIIEELYNEKKDIFDCSKIPDALLGRIGFGVLWRLCDWLASFVIPQEYGINGIMKKKIGNVLCKPLFEDVLFICDLSLHMH